MTTQTIKTYHTKLGARAFELRIQKRWPGLPTNLCCTRGLDFRDMWYVEVYKAGKWYPVGPLA